MAPRSSLAPVGELALCPQFVTDVVERIGLAVLVGRQRGSRGGHQVLIAAERGQDQAGEPDDLRSGDRPDPLWLATVGRGASCRCHRCPDKTAIRLATMWRMAGAAPVAAMRKPNRKHTSACTNFRPAYRCMIQTATPRIRTREIETVTHLPPPVRWCRR